MVEIGREIDNFEVEMMTGFNNFEVKVEIEMMTGIDNCELEVENFLTFFADALAEPTW